MRPALETGAQQIVATAKNYVAVDEGETRDSIRYQFGGGDGDPDLTIEISAGGATVPQAWWLEFGVSPHDNGGKFKGTKHPGTNAAPFFYPAYRANKKSVKARISRAMNKAIKDSL